MSLVSAGAGWSVGRARTSQQKPREIDSMTYPFAGASLIALAAAGLLAQTAARPPAFEVASIKPSDGVAQPRMVVRQGRVDFSNVSLKDIVVQAYKLEAYQVKAPGWMAGKRFNITATIPVDVPREQTPAMLRTLLEDRFKLKVHRETKEESVYGLVVAKGGPKLKKAADAGDAKPGPGGPGPQPGPGTAIMKMSGPATIHVEMRRATMLSFSRFLTGRLNRPVLDRTGITGEYDIDFDASIMETNKPDVAPEGSNGSPMAPPPPPPSMAIGTAIQQLGLSLESRKAPVEWLVVDSAEKAPTEN